MLWRLLKLSRFDAGNYIITYKYVTEKNLSKLYFYMCFFHKHMQLIDKICYAFELQGLKGNIVLFLFEDREYWK